MKSMGAIEMGLTEEELQPLVDSWRTANPNIVRFWWDVDRAVKKAVKQREPSVLRGIRFECRSGMLFIALPSGRRLAYVKPRIGENRFGGESVTYEGVGGTKKWERIESYGPKFVENIVQAVSRDILMYAIRTLSHCFIVGHVHDELTNNLAERVTIEELSRKYLMNTTTLKRCFKQVYGETIAAHMKKHRMEEAASLLLKTQNDIAAIAQAVGYESQSRFTAAFKETYGELPTEYRRKRS